MGKGVSLWVYAQTPVPWERELAGGLNGRLVRAFDGETFWIRGKRVGLTKGDTVITLSGEFPKVDWLNVLNGGDKQVVDNEHQTISMLKSADILTPRYSSGRQQDSERWLGRMWGHKGAADLLNPSQRPDFWSERMRTPYEFRIHIFNGKIIGVGRKTPSRPNHHPWIRTEASGWGIQYGAKAEIGRRLKSLLDMVMESMNVDFASLDLGELEGGETVVFGLDRVPKLDSRVLQGYMRAFTGDVK